jgi:hypothetical protein
MSEIIQGKKVVVKLRCAKTELKHLKFSERTARNIAQNFNSTIRLKFKAGL